MIEPDILAHSPNYTIGAIRGRTVIIHGTRSGVAMNPSEFIGTLNYMRQYGTTSSQWVIGRDGTKARVVNDDCWAWHAQEDNDNAFGIELEQGVEDDGITAPQLAALVAVCKSYMADFGVPPVHVGASNLPGFVGHQETVQGRRNGKSDPGRLFPWGAFIAALTAPAERRPVGVGAHYADGSDEEIWTERPGKTVDGFGMRYSDGSIVRLWPQ